MIGTRLYLTERDLTLLTAVGRVPFLSSQELEILFFAPNGTGWAHGYASYRMKRLRQLTAHRLLLAWQPAPRTHRIYALTPSGKKTVVARAKLSPEAVAAFTRPGLPAAPPTHFRLLAQAHTALLLTLRDGGVQLADYRGEHTFRGRGNFDRVPAPDSGERLPAVPDGLAVLRRADGKQRLVFIEADTGSEPLTTIVRKIRAYEGYRSGYGAELFHLRFDAPPAFSVLFVCAGEKRHENVRRTITAALHRLARSEMLRRYPVTTPARLSAAWAALLQ